jgi:hypothetical protein
MELYLNWLNKYERQEGEEAPIGLILCTQAGSEQVVFIDSSSHRRNQLMVVMMTVPLPYSGRWERRSAVWIIPTDLAWSFKV